MRRWSTIGRGQATVELALAIPLLMTVLLAAVQVTIVIRAQLAVTAAAREAARAAAVSADPVGAAATTAQSATSLEGLEVHTAAGERIVRVEVRARVPTDVPLVGALLGDVTVTADASMSLET